MGERVRLIYSAMLLATFGALLVVISITCLPIDCKYHQNAVGNFDNRGLIKETGSVRVSDHLALRSRQTGKAPYEMESAIVSSYPRLLQQADTTDSNQPDDVMSDPLTSYTFPAVALCVASLLFLCSLAPHFYEWRHRCYRGKRSDEQKQPQAEHVGRPKEHAEGSSAMVTTRTSNESSSDHQDNYRAKLSRDLELLDEEEYFYPIRRILPPLPPDICDLDSTLSPYQECLSRVSTLTASVAECRDEGADETGGHAGDIGTRETAGPNDPVTSRGSTGLATGNIELSEQFRVPREGEIAKHMKLGLHPGSGSSIRHTEADCVEEDDQSHPSSTCSSLTGEVIGVTCLQDDQVTPTKKKTESLSYCSLQFSPDTTEVNFVARDIALVGKLLEGLFQDDESENLATSSVSDTEPSEAPSQIQSESQDLAPRGSSSFCLEEDIDPIPADEYVRDIFFAPVSRYSRDTSSNMLGGQRTLDVILGVRLINASSPVTHPSVAEILERSPLSGRIFEGDFILKLNEADLTGFHADDVVRLIDKHNEEESRGDDTAGDDERSSAESSGASKYRYRYKMMKMTIMSSHRDETMNDDDDEDSDLEDTGVRESCVEL